MLNCDTWTHAALSLFSAFATVWQTFLTTLSPSANLSAAIQYRAKDSQHISQTACNTTQKQYLTLGSGAEAIGNMDDSAGLISPHHALYCVANSKRPNLQIAQCCSLVTGRACFRIWHQNTSDSTTKQGIHTSYYKICSLWCKWSPRKQMWQITCNHIWYFDDYDCTQSWVHLHKWLDFKTAAVRTYIHCNLAINVLHF